MIELKNTLISTKVLFRVLNIRTYLNDELHFKLPDGTSVAISENELNYSVDLYLHLLPDFAAGNSSQFQILHTESETGDEVLSRLMYFSPEKLRQSMHVLVSRSLPRITTRFIPSMFLVKLRDMPVSRSFAIVKRRQSNYTRLPMSRKWMRNLHEA